MSDNNHELMMEMYIFETNQLMEQLEEILLNSENVSTISKEDINEIFRIMHTVKGSSSMMMFSNITKLAHSVEDLFYFIREDNLEDFDCNAVCDIVLSALDFIREETYKIEKGKETDGNENSLIEKINEILLKLKSKMKDNSLYEEKESKKHIKSEQECCISECNMEEDGCNKFVSKIFFQEDCQMENIRAFTIVHNLKDICNEIYHDPSDLFDNEESANYISLYGFTVYFSTDYEYEEVKKNLEGGLFIKSLELKQIEAFDEKIENLLVKNDNDIEKNTMSKKVCGEEDITVTPNFEEMNDAVKSLKQNLINVNIEKLDKLMDLVGEIVITESMVTKNPDLEGLQLDNFSKSARQLRKLTDELQDVVMAVRMLPIENTFNKMKRIVRDMAKKFGKEVELVISGEETEVDKSIIDNLGDPLMHIIRNAMDHGIEPVEVRREKGKPQKARITLEAFNTGGDVIIRVSDDGRGLSRDKIIKKARENDLISKPDDEISDREAFSLIMLPGFSTKEEVTEFSGRGVGMDVVKRNIEKVGGNIFIESRPGEGTTISIKIPLTLAIIDSMQIRTGKCIYTIPTISIKESFKANPKDLIEDTDGNEMIMIRGNCYPIVRLHKHFKTKSNTTELCEGIMVMVESETKATCLFSDELIGEQQVVVKPLPGYLVQYPVKQIGIGGCTILGDGSISLIIDVMEIINKTVKGE